MRELALNSSSPRPWKPHGTSIQLQLSRLLGSVEQNGRGDEVGEFHRTLRAVHGTTQRTFHRRCPWYPHAKGGKGSRPVEVRSQRASIRTACTAPQILPAAASSFTSLRPEVRKRVAQSDLWLHSDCGPPVASRSLNLFLPKRPRGAYFMVLSNAGCKVGRRIRQRGFLVGWCNSAEPILCLLDRLWCLRNQSKMVKCLGAETSLAAHSVKQPAVQTCNHLHPGPAKNENSMGFDSSSLVSCLAHVTVCLLEQHHRRHSITLTSVPLEHHGRYAAN